MQAKYNNKICYLGRMVSDRNYCPSRGKSHELKGGQQVLKNAVKALKCRKH